MRQQQIQPWNAKQIIGEGKHQKFTFEGAGIGSIKIGGGVKFYLSDDSFTHIELWMPFTLERHGQSHLYDPHEPTTLAPLLELIGKAIVEATAKDGLLELEFSNKVKIQALSDQSGHQWEAWQITDRHGFQVVCGIGGRLPVWMLDAESSRRRNKPDNPHFD